MATNNLEQRLSAVESVLAQLKKRVEGTGKPWWEQICGKYADDPYYEAAMKLAREWRESFPPEASEHSSQTK